MKIKGIELFAGAGGLALGLEEAGIHGQAFVEFDKSACNTLRKNKPNWNVIEGDIATVDFKKYHGKIDVVSGGAPCQAFSYAGKRLGFGDTRGTLFAEFARCLKEVEPKMFLFENVKGLLTHDKGRTFKTIIHEFESFAQYGKKLESYSVKEFNRNTVDPIKMIFDKAVYGEDWETIISSEIFRQRDKSNTNEIGYFHQRLFDYIKNCRVPDNGQEGGWDVIFEGPEGYKLDNGNKVSKIFVEMKNKHNTMNSASATKTYMKMQNQLLNDDDCACFLVEVIAKCSQNIVWNTSVDRQKVSHKRIRRVSIDKFYEVVTGDPDAFYKLCIALPEVVKEVIEESEGTNVPDDTVYEEIKKVAEGFKDVSYDLGMILSMYMLGFSTYMGFDKIEKEGSLNK